MLRVLTPVKKTVLSEAHVPNFPQQGDIFPLTGGRTNGKLRDSLQSENVVCWTVFENKHSAISIQHSPGSERDFRSFGSRLRRSSSTALRPLAIGRNDDSLIRGEFTPLSFTSCGPLPTWDWDWVWVTLG